MTAESKIFKGQIADNFFLSTSQHKMSSTCTFAVTRKPKMDKNRSYEKGGLFHPRTMGCLLRSDHGYRRLHQTTQRWPERLLSSSHRWRCLRHDQRQIPTRGYSTILLPVGSENGAADQIGNMRDFRSMGHFETLIANCTSKNRISLELCRASNSLIT